MVGMGVFLLICAGVAVAGLIDWVWIRYGPNPQMRSALLTGAGVYLALTLNDLFMK
jgi:hypothetical protein